MVRPWYKGGGRYGVWRYIYGRNMVYRPTRAGVNMARGVAVVELYGFTDRLQLFTHRHCISLYIKIMYPHNVPQISKSEKSVKIHKSQIFLFKKNACLQQDIYVY
jgi:hypothetical protein